ESNFASLQSGLGLTVIGTRAMTQEYEFTGKEAFAVIGKPLVGNEVLERPDEVAPLWLFQRLCQLKLVKAILPAGSKGVAAAWRNWTKRANKPDCALGLKKIRRPGNLFPDCL